MDKALQRRLCTISAHLSASSQRLTPHLESAEVIHGPAKVLDRRERRLRNRLIREYCLCSVGWVVTSSQETLTMDKKTCGMPVIVGAMVLDIHAVPFSADSKYVTTIPGKVSYVQGGVGRNVAECIAKLGVPPFLISVVGQDMAGELLVNRWLSLGLSIEGIRRSAEFVTPVVSAIFDTKGELAAAVADVMTLEEHMTPDWIHQFADIIQMSPVLMVDANLKTDVLKAACSLAREANVPIWFEPVSVSKSVRATDFLEHITFTSPNEAELISMAENLTSFSRKLSLGSSPTKSGAGVKDIIWKLRHHIYSLLMAGIKFIILTLGMHGVVLCFIGNNDMLFGKDPIHEIKLSSQVNSATTFVAKTFPTNSSNVVVPLLAEISTGCNSSNVSRKQFKLIECLNESFESHPQYAAQSKSEFMFIHLPALPATVVNVNGAGDCLVGGTMAAFSIDYDFVKSLAFGVAVAKLAVQSNWNIPESLSKCSLSDDAQFVMSHAQMFHIHV